MKRKKFKGWAVVVSRGGSNWGQDDDRKQWPIVSKIVKTKKELDNVDILPEFMTLFKSCCPRMAKKIYE
jgi:hypothetical protein